MRIYPDTPNERGRAVARDALTLLTLFVLAWLALKVHDTVDKLAVLGTGVRDSGNAVQDGFGAAADAVSGVPVVGGEVGDALRDAGSGTGGEVADAGSAGEERVHDLANLLGFLFFAIPASILLLTTLPARIRQVRELNAAQRLLGEPASEERRRLIAMRAAFSLPARDLARYTKDPLGDLELGRYDPLIEAAYEAEGLAKLPDSAGLRRPRPPRRPRRRRLPLGGAAARAERASPSAELATTPSGGFTSDASAALRPTFSIRTSVFSPTSVAAPDTDTT